MTEHFGCPRCLIVRGETIASDVPYKYCREHEHPVHNGIVYAEKPEERGSHTSCNRARTREETR